MTKLGSNILIELKITSQKYLHAPFEIVLPHILDMAIAQLRLFKNLLLIQGMIEKQRNTLSFPPSLTLFMREDFEVDDRLTPNMHPKITV